MKPQPVTAAPCNFNNRQRCLLEFWFRQVPPSVNPGRP